MAKVEKSIEIAAPPEKVFAYLNDPMAMPQWMPGMIEVSDIVGEGVGLHYKWVYKMAGIRFSGESAVQERVPDERIVVKGTGGIPNTWVWSLTPEKGGTKLDLAVEYTVPVPVLGKLAEPLVVRQNDREAELALTNLKAQVESG